jgi:hypothetical protein
MTTLIIINSDNDDNNVISFLVFHNHTNRGVYLIGFVVVCRLPAYSCFSYLFIYYHKKHQMRMKNKMRNVVRQMTHNEKGN